MIPYRDSSVGIIVFIYFSDSSNIFRPRCLCVLELMVLELNNDQRREIINARQRYEAWRNAKGREAGFKGSMVWDQTKGHEYLLRSFYDEHGKRRQKSLGKRSPDTETMKSQFDLERESAISARKQLDEVTKRQASINRALNLGRVPLDAARVLRALDGHGLLGRGVRVIGTVSLYAYEAACGVHIDSSVAATEDIDLLFDSRRKLRLLAPDEVAAPDLISMLQRADRSFRTTRRLYRAENDRGYMVDFTKPEPSPPWKKSRNSIGASGDLEAAEIEGLSWLENAPDFEQIAVDERGFLLRIIAVDPRVFAVHKLWLSKQALRDPIKKLRDREQALTVARLAVEYLQHLPFNSDALRMLPLEIVESAITEFRQSMQI